MADSNVNNIIKELNSSAQNINNWLKDLKLSISFEKSRFIVFSNNSSKVQDSQHSIKFDNIILNNCSSIKYLGIIWDSGLKCREHINYVRNKGKRLTGILSYVSKLHRGAHPIVLQYLFINSLSDLVWIVVDFCIRVVGVKIWRN